MIDFIVGLASQLSSHALLTSATHLSLFSLTSSGASNSRCSSSSPISSKGLNGGLSFPSLILSIISAAVISLIKYWMRTFYFLYDSSQCNILCNWELLMWKWWRYLSEISRFCWSKAHFGLQFLSKLLQNCTRHLFWFPRFCDCQWVLARSRTCLKQ